MQAEVTLPGSAAPSPSLPGGCAGCGVTLVERGRMVPTSDALARRPNCTHRHELQEPFASF